MVAAKRSWPTSSARRSRSSSTVPSIRSRPTTGRSSASATPSKQSGDHSSGAIASLPRSVAGDVVDSNTTSSADHATSAQPISVAPTAVRRLPDSDERRSPRGEGDGQPDRGADRDPLEGVAGEAEGGEGADDHARHDAHEQHAARLADRGGAQRDGSVHRRQQHVRDVGVLERERPAPRTGAQAEQHGERHDRSGHGRPALQDVLHGGGRRIVRTEQRRQEEDGRPREGDREVRLVRGVRPVDVGEVPAAAGDPQRAEHRPSRAPIVEHRGSVSRRFPRPRVGPPARWPAG